MQTSLASATGVSPWVSTRGILALPQLAQGGHAVPDALRLAGDLVDAIPRAPEGAFELVQRVPQRGHQVTRLVRLCHTLSLLCWSALPAVCTVVQPVRPCDVSDTPHCSRVASGGQASRPFSPCGILRAS